MSLCAFAEGPNPPSHSPTTTQPLTALSHPPATALSQPYTHPRCLHPCPAISMRVSPRRLHPHPAIHSCAHLHLHPLRPHSGSPPHHHHLGARLCRPTCQHVAAATASVALVARRSLRIAATAAHADFSNALQHGRFSMPTRTQHPRTQY